MAAYVVFIRNSVCDPAGMKTYAKMAGEARGDHRFDALAYYNPCETPEGEAAEGVVLLKFDDIEAARAWYHSDAYQAAAKVRQGSSDYRVIITEGL
ncbi:MAG: DUF1330 domain-containing protein [Sphingomonadales bacterium]|nr:DUF1330 domain-containing protein [Sphingomonadales bacterium]MDE2569714.1 DUF1330 domain-containing protein [Sphingomonadales bacterium]